MEQPQLGGGRAGGRRGMVFVVKDGKYSPRVVRLGVSNYDVSEVLSGLTEGDSVAILNVAAMQARQQAEMDQVRNRGGVPGMQRQQQGGQGGAGGARWCSGQSWRRPERRGQLMTVPAPRPEERGAKSPRHGRAERERASS